ncbi:MAG: hypothetical protein IH947_13970 [Bacteroidetes bacterium]|nr:hypothetical protein [Bacteroidota bacterium]
MKNQLFLVGVVILFCFSCEMKVDKSPVFEISFSEALSSGSFDGRLLLLISTNDENEPRFQISDGTTTQQVYGVDVAGMKPGEPVRMDGQAFGYPVRSLSELAPGEYYVQAFLHKYDTYTLANGHTVSLPASWAAGSRWNREPGNYYSTPIKVTIGSGSNIKIVMDQEIPPVTEPEDTRYIRHIKMQSKLLTEFWGRPMELGAHVLLPEGFDAHPEARYPLMVFHGHFPRDFGGFRTEPPDPGLEPDYSERFHLEGYNKIMQQEAYDFYKKWISNDFPRFIVILIQHANPYYDDSYAVNSANLGPYGDAITYELIPYVEDMFRGIGEGWARFLYGGSTGGWEALAVQVMYPDEYNGCFAACPDPIDFRAYTVVNIYEDENAYRIKGTFKDIKRPGHRDYLGHISSYLEDMNHRELALGTHSRSGQQWDIWEAVYSPVGDDGYPARIWNKETGEINPKVAKYWRDNYDLRYIMERDWKTLGPKLKGKLHIYCGDMDNYYLNNAVYLTEEFLEGTTDPYYDGEVDYGDRAEHCWNGDHENPNAISRLRYNTMYLPKILKRIEESAPKGADLTSWRY